MFLKPNSCPNMTRCGGSLQRTSAYVSSATIWLESKWNMAVNFAWGRTANGRHYGCDLTAWTTESPHLAFFGTYGLTWRLWKFHRCCIGAGTTFIHGKSKPISLTVALFHNQNDLHPEHKKLCVMWILCTVRKVSKVRFCSSSLPLSFLSVHKKSSDVFVLQIPVQSASFFVYYCDGSSYFCPFETRPLRTSRNDRSSSEANARWRWSRPEGASRNYQRCKC